MQNGTFSKKAVISVAVIGIPLIISATWFVRVDYIDDLKYRINAYEKAEKWKLPETINKINSASEKMSLTINERNRLNGNEIILTELTAKNIEISKELEKAKSTLLELESTIKNINSTPETIELSPGESHSIFRNVLFIGLKRIETKTRAEFNLNNEPVFLDLGVIHQYPFMGKKCVVTVTEINYIKDIVKISNACN